MKKKARKSTKPVKELSKQEEVAHYTAIIVEDLKSSFNMVIEKVDGLEESLNHKIDVKFAEQDLRFDRIEFVLGRHGDTLKEHGKILKEHGEILKEHSETLDRLETKFDVLAKKVDQHDEAIQEIQQQHSHE